MFRRFLGLSCFIGVLLFGQILTKDQPLNYSIAANTLGKHYSKPTFNDTYSMSALEEYIDRLDPHKRFFLQEDVDSFEVYNTQLDDELLTNKFTVFDLVEERFRQRVLEVRGLLPPLFEDIHYYRYETLETDADKRSFSQTFEDREDYWRRLVKYQIITNYFSFVDTDVSEDAKEADAIFSMDYIDPELERKAIDRVSKNINESLSFVLDMEKDERLQYYYDALLSVLDSYSSFYPPDKKEDFDISISGKLEGIGAVLREDEGFIVVDRIIIGSACWKQGELKEGDKILKVAQADEAPVDLVGLRVRDAVKYIRGEKGTEVRLTVRKPSGKIQVIPIIRDVVEIEETYARAAIIEDDRTSRTFGYIQLPKFYRDFNDSKSRNTTSDVEKLLEELMDERVEGVILDLRNNAGGALKDAIETAGLFIDPGPIVQVQRRTGRQKVHKSNSKRVYDGPLVIMLNKFSASASEILAAALQDYNRAVIVGSDSSFGKGTVQTFIDLDAFIDYEVSYRGKPKEISEFKPYGALKLTIEKFYRINGDSTQEKGVIPDIILPDRYGHLEIGEKYNDHALKWDTIDPVRYSPWGMGLNLSYLQKRSKSRTENSEDFQHIFDHVAFLEKNKEVTIEPLHIKKAYEKKRLIEEEDDLFHEQYNVSSTHLTITSIVEETDNEELIKEQEEKNATWHESLLKDPYLDETLYIISDLVKSAY